MSSTRRPTPGFWTLIALLVLVGPASFTGCRQQAPGERVEAGPTEDSSDQASSGSIAFRQVSSPQLEQFIYHSGREAGLNTILEIIGGGVACLDYDLDGHQDLFFAGGGSFDRQTRTVNGTDSLLVRGGPGFSYSDMTGAAGAAAGDLYSHGATAADYDHDGFVDLLVYGYRGVRLLRNQGDGTFQDVTSQAGLDRAPWTTAAGWGDLTGDGSLDLYLGSYVQWDMENHRDCPGVDGQPDVCSPNAFIGSEDAIFLGDDQGRFSSGTDRVDVPLNGRALGVLMAKLQPGEPLSIYVTNDLTPNYLLHRQEDGRFKDIGLTAGVAVDAVGNPDGSMGVSLLDFHGDQRFDLIVTNFEHEQIALYRNDGDLLFRHASREVGLNSLDASVVGFGIAAADFSGDGLEDVLLTSGHVKYRFARGEIRQEPVLLENVEGRRFRRQQPDCEYFHRKSCGRGVALADLDNDGDQDAIITHLFEPAVILENLSGSANSWLRVGLTGTQSSRTPIGTVVTVTVGDQTMVRQLFGGGSYLSHSQSELFFHWPGDEAAEVVVEWPSGEQQRLSDVAPRQVLRLLEPSA